MDDRLNCKLQYYSSAWLILIIWGSKYIKQQLITYTVQHTHPSICLLKMQGCLFNCNPTHVLVYLHVYLHIYCISGSWNRMDRSRIQIITFWQYNSIEWSTTCMRIYINYWWYWNNCLCEFMYINIYQLLTYRWFWICGTFFFSWAKNIMGHFERFFEGPRPFWALNCPERSKGNFGPHEKSQQKNYP